MLLTPIQQVARPPAAFRTPYREVRLPYLRVAEDAAAELDEGWPPEAGAAVTEELVKAIWFEQRLVWEHLRLADGAPVTVLEPGWWNRAEGPDFTHAAVRLAGGATARGDIEVHVRSSAWEQHGHHVDARYNRVILHVVMWQDTAAPTVCRQDGARVPTLPLFPALAQELTELRRTLDVARYPLRSEVRTGYCQPDLQRCAPEVVASLLDQAGDERLSAKAEGLAERLKETSPAAVLYESVAEGLGLVSLRGQFRELARRLPWARLEGLRSAAGGTAGDPATGPGMEPDLRLEALLFQHAGLLPETASGSGDAATADYLRRLLAAAATVAAAESEPPMEGARWRVPGTRPAGQPVRRIAALAAFLRASEPLLLVERCMELARACRDLHGKKRRLGVVRRAVEALCLVEGPPFWQRRLGFGPATLRRPLNLVGVERARILVVNVLLPAALALARQHADADVEEGLHVLYAALPKAAENSAVRFARRRMLGERSAHAGLVTTARRQQGLQQLLRDFCSSDPGGCLTCSFPSLAGALRQLTPAKPSPPT
ncbi:MAG: DUF2851 family protein [Candidatus Tectomicrobia bacterium]|nr:DUF2851 family protein [Candidatus Tectomicrobia bacterium]